MALTPADVLKDTPATADKYERYIDAVLADLDPMWQGPYFVMLVPLPRCPNLAVQNVLQQRYESAGWSSFEVQDGGRGYWQVALRSKVEDSRG